MCHAMINLLHNCQYSILGVRHAWEATYFRPVQFTQISLKLNPIFLQIFYISSLRYEAKYFIDELLFLSFISSHVKFQNSARFFFIFKLASMSFLIKN